MKVVCMATKGEEVKARSGDVTRRWIRPGFALGEPGSAVGAIGVRRGPVNPSSCCLYLFLRTVRSFSDRVSILRAHCCGAGERKCLLFFPVVFPSSRWVRMQLGRFLFFFPLAIPQPKVVGGEEIQVYDEQREKKGTTVCTGAAPVSLERPSQGGNNVSKSGQSLGKRQGDGYMKPINKVNARRSRSRPIERTIRSRSRRRTITTSRQRGRQDERMDVSDDSRRLSTAPAPGHNFRWIYRRHKMIPKGCSRRRVNSRHRRRNDEKSTVDGEMEQIVDRASFDRLVMCTLVAACKARRGWIIHQCTLYPYKLREHGTFEYLASMDGLSGFLGYSIVQKSLTQAAAKRCNYGRQGRQLFTYITQSWDWTNTMRIGLKLVRHQAVPFSEMRSLALRNGGVRLAILFLILQHNVALWSPILWTDEEMALQLGGWKGQRDNQIGCATLLRMPCIRMDGSKRLASFPFIELSCRSACICLELLLKRELTDALVWSVVYLSIRICKVSIIPALTGNNAAKRQTRLFPFSLRTYEVPGVEIAEEGPAKKLIDGRRIEVRIADLRERTSTQATHFLANHTLKFSFFPSTLETFSLTSRVARSLGRTNPPPPTTVPPTIHPPTSKRLRLRGLISKPGHQHINPPSPQRQRRAAQLKHARPDGGGPLRYAGRIPDEPLGLSLQLAAYLTNLTVVPYQQQTILPARLETHFSPDRATFGSAPPHPTVSHTGRAQGPKGPFQVASRFLNPQLDTLGHSRWLRLWSLTRRQDAKCTGDAELQSRRLPCLARLTSLVTFTTLASPLINNQRTDCSSGYDLALSLPPQVNNTLLAKSHSLNRSVATAVNLPNLILSFGSKLRRPRPTLVIDFNTQLGSSQDVSASLLLQLMQAMAHVCALADLTWSYGTTLRRVLNLNLAGPLYPRRGYSAFQKPSDFYSTPSFIGPSLELLVEMQDTSICTALNSANLAITGWHDISPPHYLRPMLIIGPLIGSRFPQRQEQNPVVNATLPDQQYHHRRYHPSFSPS
ncbi:hypothetical protein CCUS01_08299 [Colletotrichum cuscutae]|uniref:Uncharacterized protein n=1 Tax=Colletotrichum cuscutae TaxID=1209917 RepID=A0AAI9URZ4_9PEZI|nr:hypothetical protein CCUS01_08299 [Colletotrichum cuscutae]